MYILRHLALEASSSLLILPVYFIINRYWLHDVKKTALYWLFSCYLACVYALVGLPNVTYIRFEPSVNLIPLMGIREDLKNCLLNVLLFLPLGFFLSLISNRVQSLKTITWTGLGTSLSIEVMQIFAGRATDVNDLITNTLGAVLGYFLACICAKKRPVINGTNRELAVVLSLCAGTMFFVQPFVTQLLWVLTFRTT